MNLYYNGTDIYNDVSVNYCVHDMYAEKQADTLVIRFNDTKGTWSKWNPAAGDTLRFKEVASDTGKMFIHSMKPENGLFTIRAMSMPKSGATKKSKSWEGVRFLQLGKRSDTLNEFLQQITSAAVPVLCLLITAAGAYLVALLRKKTDRLQQEIENETSAKYIGMACEAVSQAVTYTAQTFVDALKSDGAFTQEKQLEAFAKAKDKALQILGDTAVAALQEIYGDFDAWLETKIEQKCWGIKQL